MKLDDLLAQISQQDFPAVGQREHPEKGSVLAARAAVTTAVCDDEFLIDCMVHELALLEQHVARRGLVPFYILPGLGIRFAFGYWPPHSSAGAHEHTAWTITAVCRNELTVQTYDRDESYRLRELVSKNVFDAPAGRVGFIYSPSIHNPSNPTNQWSLSLHVTSPRDGEKIQDEELCLPALEILRSRRRSEHDTPYTIIADTRFRQVVIQQIAHFVANSTDSSARDLLSRCHRLGSISTRRFIHTLGGTDLELSITDVGPSASTLVLTHPDLTLSCRTADDFVALGIETDDGWEEQFRMARIGSEAIDFCAHTPRFDINDLPGCLTPAEQWAIAEVLESSGVFRMEAS